MKGQHCMDINQKTVLIADSNKVDVLRLSVLLKRLDYSVFTVLSCYDVIKKTAGYHPDIVLMSINMSDMNSTVCMEQVKRDAHLKAIPFLTMGEKSDAKALEECLEKGAASYILKPINPTLLYCAIQKATEKKPRENVRVRIIFKVTILCQNQKRVSFASNLSEAGVFIRSIKPIPVGTKVSIAMDLPSTKPIEVEGVIINIVEFNRDSFIEPGMCIRFTNIDKDIQLGLRKFVEEQLTYDLDPNLNI